VQLAVIDTLGIFYLLSGDPAITSLDDVSGRTVLSMAKGTTPQLVFDTVLAGTGLADDVTVDYRSQPPEVATLLTTTPTDIAVLPEPYVTSVMEANPSIHIVDDLNTSWQQVTGSPLVTDCVAIRTQFAEQHPQAVATFLQEYAASVAFLNEHPDQAAPLIVNLGIAPDADVAQKAIPRANVVDMTGADAKKAATDYLNVLLANDPTSVGGAIPGADFFFQA
jgi:NitT/TauT family transport system substrate-binding protein